METAFDCFVIAFGVLMFGARGRGVWSGLNGSDAVNAAWLPSPVYAVLIHQRWARANSSVCINSCVSLQCAAGIIMGSIAEQISNSSREARQAQVRTCCARWACSLRYSPWLLHLHAFTTTMHACLPACTPDTACIKFNTCHSTLLLACRPTVRRLQQCMPGHAAA